MNDIALVAGDCPIFLEIQGFKEIFFHMFRKDTKVRVEFGAEQVCTSTDLPLLPYISFFIF